MKIIKIIFLIIWTLWCFLGILKNYSHYGFADWVIILTLTIFPYIIVYFMSRKKPETANGSSQTLSGGYNCAKSADVKSELNPLSITPDFPKEQSISYIETENAIYRTDGEPISDKEVPYLVQIGQEKAFAQWKIPELERLIKESYQLMCVTNNPETLCSRYKFIVEKINELAYFEQNGAFNKDSFIQYTILVTEDNYCKLISACYTKYVNKAHSELTTQKGINNRIDKFWKIIRQNVNDEFYNKIICICAPKIK